jgi:hypothetical protein
MSEDPALGLEADSACLDRFATIGVTFPENALPRAVIFSEQEMAEKGGRATPGVAVYLLSPEWDRDMVRYHEMAHIFVNAHLVPNQPEPYINWDKITDDMAIALGIDGFRRVRFPDVWEPVKDGANAILEASFPDRRERPFDALVKFAEMTRDTKGDSNDSDDQSALQEAIKARVHSSLVSELTYSIYPKYGYHTSRDFEEAVVSYLAHHATSTPIDDRQGEFHHSDGSRDMAFVLGEHYPNPSELADLIKTMGMSYLLETHRGDLIEAA